MQYIYLTKDENPEHINNFYNNKKINNPNKICQHSNKLFQIREYIQMVKKYMKICSASSIIKEMRTKTKVKLALETTRITVVKKTENFKCWPGSGTTRVFIHH